MFEFFLISRTKLRYWIKALQAVYNPLIIVKLKNNSLGIVDATH